MPKTAANSKPIAYLVAAMPNQSRQPAQNASENEEGPRFLGGQSLPDRFANINCLLCNRPTVREGGLEPPCPHGHTDLNRARLPISPLAQT